MWLFVNHISYGVVALQYDHELRRLAASMFSVYAWWRSKAS